MSEYGCLWIYKGDHAKLKKYCEQSGKSMASVVRKLIDILEVVER